MKSIYTIYKERLVEISGKSRSIYSKKGDTKYSIDLGKFFNKNPDLFEELIENVWKGNAKPIEIINKETILNLYSNLNIEQELRNNPKYLQLVSESKEEGEKYLNQLRGKELRKLVRSSVSSFSSLKNELTDTFKETGRYELYIGYPFVEGVVGKDATFKAPLLLFPVKIDVIDDSHVNIELIKEMPITLNKALLFAYAKERKVNIDDLNMEFNGNFTRLFKNYEDVRKYLKEAHINIGEAKGKLAPFKEGSSSDSLHLTNNCVIGRYPLSNSIYLDYSELESKKITPNRTINELVFAKSPNKNKTKGVNSLYNIHDLDFLQEKALRKINDEQNVVIYGPPGTGKSQTIVNIVSDALSRNKRVLIVSQKKAALDVVYNRLGEIQNKAMLITDPEHEKEMFYKRSFNSHKEIQRYDLTNEYKALDILDKKIREELGELKKIYDTLYSKGEFGISLEEMYEQSSQISKNSYDYKIYEEMLKRKDLLEIKYDTLKVNLDNIDLNNRRDLYYKYEVTRRKNPIVDYINNDLDVYTVDNAISKLDTAISDRFLGYNISKYEYTPYLLANYIYNNNMSDSDISKLVTFIAKQNHKKGIFTKSNFEKELTDNFKQSLKELDLILKDYEIFENVLSKKGYQLFKGALLNGNVSVLKNFRGLLNNYSKVRDVKLELAALNEDENKILEFAFNSSDNEGKFNQVLDHFMPIRMYGEIVKKEQDEQENLAKIMNFDSIKERILALKKRQQLLSETIAAHSFDNKYLDTFENSKKQKDFLYQVSKQQNTWPIRKFMKEYEDIMLDLYPCYLMSPETASTILPLHKDMFDLVLVDEASQVFIENTLPLMYRAKNIVISGDHKQLRPTSTFVKRYSGSDIEEDVDPTLEASLEVESLLDLSISRLPGSNLNYHYRSKKEELIDFSNNYFYNGELEVVPNLVSNGKERAIERIKVDGIWDERKNKEEAIEAVRLLKKTLLHRKNNESIGIVAFNSEQVSAIEGEIKAECKRDPKFNELVLKEYNRYNGNEDISLFVKNLENVQGDERDIMIFSIGYAPNSEGKILANFGSLSLEGGENRLNVAISRAKSKIYVITSFEPEDLKVSSTKNEGPKILKKYLTYIRAVSNNKQDEVKLCLNNKKQEIDDDLGKDDLIAKEIKDKLEQLGYLVEVKVGNTNKKIDLAVYDKKLGRYLLGIECTDTHYESFSELVEKQLYHSHFLQDRGWNINHVWTRDWWNNKTKVINSLVKNIEDERKRIQKEALEVKNIKK